MSSASVSHNYSENSVLHRNCKSQETRVLIFILPLLHDHLEWSSELILILGTSSLKQEMAWRFLCLSVALIDYTSEYILEWDQNSLQQCHGLALNNLQPLLVVFPQT
jgi:hypothetical protein